MDEAIVERAVRLLRAGGLVALPTETVYGLAADAANPAAVRRIYAVKGRPAEHPLILHLADRSWVARYAAAIPPGLERLAERFWPGPLTVVVAKSAAVSPLVTGGQETVALRVADHPLAHAVIAGFGAALAAPSANRFGRVSPTTAQHVRDDLGPDVDLVVDGGPARVGVESTIVDLSGAVPAILRAGAIGPTALGDVLGVPVVARVGADVRAPGTLAAHYAPRAALILARADELPGEAARRTERGERVGILTLPSDAAAAAQTLYATLRGLDGAGYDTLLAVLPPDDEANAAVRDRLLRAAAASAST